MKKYLSVILICGMVMFFLPVVFLKNQSNPITENFPVQETQEEIETVKPDTITVFRSAQQENTEIDFFEYVCGSVAAEMPLSYHEEALKAQAVACYTNALRLKNNANGQSNYHISDDSSIHQGYLSPEQREEKWGEDFPKYESKLKTIVKAVEKEALYYKNELCVAAFHAICSGSTESAENIWGEKVPYLVSVKSNGDNLSPQYSSAVSFNKKEFLECLKNANISAKDIKTLKDAIKIEKKSKANTVLKAIISNKSYSGEDIRKIFSLKSPSFSVESTKDSITFNVTGYGHGVGMSQYGADFMARQGSDYKEILKHYYKGAEIK